MKIAALDVDSFAGIHQVSVSFTEGLNVLVGPNEAGKSTLIHALYATLFRDTQLGRGTREYKDLVRFMPHPDGQSIRTALTMCDENHKYILKKEWGSQPGTEMVMDGQLVRDSKKIAAVLGALLKYGEGTYEKIVFAKQTEFQTVLERVAGDPETAGTLSGVLRQAVMELDGVSVDALKNLIEAEYNRLADHWDEASQRPEGNRGVHQPWKTKVGEVLNQYYRLEKLKLTLEDVQSLEDQFARAAEKLKESSARREILGQDISRLGRLESDMLKRSGLEAQMRILQKEYEELKVINQEYPVLSARLVEDKSHGRKLKEELVAVEEEMKRSRLQENLRVDAEILRQVEELDRRIQVHIDAKKILAAFTDEVVARLDALERRQREAEVAMAAARLNGTYREGGWPLTIYRHRQEEEIIEAGQSFEADGYFKLQVGNDVEIEVTSGTIDYPSLEKQRMEAQQELERLLQELSVNSLAQAKKNQQKLQESTRQILNLQRQQKEILAGRDRNELIQKTQELSGISVRSLAELDPLKYEIVNGINDLKTAVLQAEERVARWEKGYGDLTQVVDQMVDRQVQLREAARELQTLPELPEEYANVDAFRTALDRMRQEATVLDQSLESLRSDYYQIKSELGSQDSLEELSQELKNAQAGYQQARTRLQAVSRVRHAFYETLEAMDQSTFEPLIQSFGSYLNQLTVGRYRTGRIDDSLEIKIVRDDGIGIPTDLLSMGTYDSVALAFRLAVLDHLFSDSPGLLVLDDCLVNLDNARREQAVALIQACARKHQVIYSTCSEETADQLGGNRILVCG